MRGVASRTAFLIDADGSVAQAWRYGTGEVPDMDVLLAAARGLAA
jgi:peroxiredoxin